MDPLQSRIQTIEDLVKKVILSHFGLYPEKIERMKIGLDNEVFSVRVENNNYIVRLNERNSLKGSDNNIPLFRSLGISVPEFVATDYSKKLIPYNWQILKKIEGEDIQNVIATLTEQQLLDLAKEIASIAKKLLVLPTDGTYGWVGFNSKKLKSSLMEEVEEMFATIQKRNEKTGVVKQEYIKFFEAALIKYGDYLKSAPSQFYYDDMCSKNVIIREGKFNGLVDLDGYAFGDYLDGIGRIKASWYGTTYGDYYTDAVMSNLELNDQQREMVCMWALLNRISWQSELGIQFNQNTSLEINQDQVEDGNKVIEGLAKELGI